MNLRTARRRLVVGRTEMRFMKFNISPASPTVSWPNGDYVELALLPLAPQEVAAAIGVEAATGAETGLGNWTAIGIQLHSGVVVELIDYADRPGPAGTIVRVDRGLDLNLVLDELLCAFELNLTMLSWVSPLVRPDNPLQATLPAQWQATLPAQWN